MSRSARVSGLHRPERTAGRRAAIELADRLHSAAIHLLRRLRREDTASGLPGPQLSALSVIVFRGPITPGALAEAEQVRPPTMTRVVSALERAGMIERLPHPADRRVVLLRATKRGQAVLKQGRLRRVEALTRDLQELSARDRAALSRSLDVLERIVGKRSELLRVKEGT